MASSDSSINLDLSLKSRKRSYTRKAVPRTSTSLSSISSAEESDSETVPKKSRISSEVKGKSRGKPNLKRQLELAEIVSDTSSEDSGVAQVDVQESQATNLSSAPGSLTDTGVSSYGSDSDERGKESLSESALQQLYDNCAKLYVAKKISPQNAFELKLVDYMQEILQLEAFRRRNLVGRVHVVEIGSKIHDIRVDHVGRLTTTLAGEVAVNSVSLDDERTEEDANNQQNSLDIAQKKERNRKKSRFIVDDESKINTRFEDQSIKYSHRRNSLKNLFFKNIEEEVDFEYLSFFVDAPATHPLKKPGEFEALGFDAALPDEKDGLQPPKWLPFATVKKWDPATHDLWGLPLAHEEDKSSVDNDSHTTLPPTCEVFTHDPDRAVNNSPVSAADSPHQDYDDSQGVDIHAENTLCNDVSDVTSVQSRPRINIEAVRSLNDLRLVFERWSLQPVPMKIRYGWLGPLFFRSTSTVHKRKGRQRGTRAKFINLEDVDFSDPANCYQIAPPEKTQLSAELLQRWKDTKSNLDNFINTREVSSFGDFYEDPYNFLEEGYPTCLETYFTNPNRRYFEGGCDPIESNSGSEDEMTQAVGGGDLCGQAGIDTECNEFLRNDLDFTEAISEPKEDSGLNSALNGHAHQQFDFQEFFPNMHLSPKDADEAEEMDAPEYRLRYCMKPRPVNMHALKKAIFEFLQCELHVDEFGVPLKAEQTVTNLPSLMQSLKDQLDDRSRENVSLHLIVVALLHVVAENRLFLTALDTCGTAIVCRGRNWAHKDNIPGSSDSHT